MCEAILECAECLDPLDETFTKYKSETPFPCPMCHGLYCEECIEDHVYTCAQHEIKNVLEFHGMLAIIEGPEDE